MITGAGGGAASITTGAGGGAASTTTGADARVGGAVACGSCDEQALHTTTAAISPRMRMRRS
jgi:hypothetical protein